MLESCTTYGDHVWRVVCKMYILKFYSLEEDMIYCPLRYKTANRRYCNLCHSVKPSKRDSSYDQFRIIIIINPTITINKIYTKINNWNGYIV